MSMTKRWAEEEASRHKEHCPRRVFGFTDPRCWCDEDDVGRCRDQIRDEIAEAEAERQWLDAQPETQDIGIHDQFDIGFTEDF